LAGRHNALNALAALAVASQEGVALDAAAAALAGFRGTRRRFEEVGRERGVRVINDYAHHPTAVRATIEAARAGHDGPLWVVFQPHTRHRTARMLPEFARALGAADHVVVTAIYEPAGREDANLAVSGADLAGRIDGPPAVYLPEFQGAVTYLQERLAAGTLLLVMGAGDVDRLGYAVARSLAGRP
jgi:UDP-N-acetylmuramate--alanine ligase